MPNPPCENGLAREGREIIGETLRARPPCSAQRACNGRQGGSHASHIFASGEHGPSNRCRGEAAANARNVGRSYPTLARRPVTIRNPILRSLPTQACSRLARPALASQKCGLKLVPRGSTLFSCLQASSLPFLFFSPATKGLDVLQPRAHHSHLSLNFLSIQRANSATRTILRAKQTLMRSPHFRGAHDVWIGCRRDSQDFPRRRAVVSVAHRRPCDGNQDRPTTGEACEANHRRCGRGEAWKGSPLLWPLSGSGGAEFPKITPRQVSHSPHHRSSLGTLGLSHRNGCWTIAHARGRVGTYAAANF